MHKLDLEIKQNYLRDALETSSLLEKYSLTDEDLKYIEGIVSQIKRIRDGDGLVVVRGSVGAGNSFYHRLLKSQFSFSEVVGDIAELRLRCEKGYVGFVYQEGTAYEAESGAGPENTSQVLVPLTPSPIMSASSSQPLLSSCLLCYIRRPLPSASSPRH